LETSAKNGANVEKLFADVGKILYRVSLENKDINQVR